MLEIGDTIVASREFPPPGDGYGGNDTSSSADMIFGSVPKRDI